MEVDGENFSFGLPRCPTPYQPYSNHPQPLRLAIGTTAMYPARDIDGSGGFTQAGRGRTLTTFFLSSVSYDDDDGDKMLLLNSSVAIAD